MSQALKIENLSKRFGGLVALDNINFSINHGDVVGLLGDNGAGKSTLVKTIAGYHAPSAGSITIEGKKVETYVPKVANQMGVETVYQSLGLVDLFDVAENLYLNREYLRENPILKWMGWINRPKMYADAQGVLDQLQIRIPSLKAPVAQLSGGQRQSVAIGRAVAFGRQIVQLDEPTAALGVEQTAQVLKLIQHLASQNIAVVLISHNMQDVLKVCNRVLVLRRGKLVANETITPQTEPDHLVGLITGAKTGVLDE